MGLHSVLFFALGHSFLHHSQDSSTTANLTDFCIQEMTQPWNYRELDWQWMLEAWYVLFLPTARVPLAMLQAMARDGSIRNPAARTAFLLHVFRCDAKLKTSRRPKHVRTTPHRGLQFDPSLQKILRLVERFSLLRLNSSHVATGPPLSP